MIPSPAVVQDFEHRILLANRESRSDASMKRAFDALRTDLRNQPDRGLAILMSLADSKAERVRDWAGFAARIELGRGGLPVLLKLAKHPRTFTRDGAMQQLAEIDIELLRPYIADMRRTLGRATTLYSEGGAAMWRLVRLDDQDSAPTFRAFAAKHEARRYDHRMPMVLADYLEDHGSIARRIRDHDHDWMLWLTMAIRQLGRPEAEATLEAGAELLPDDECRTFCAKELAGLRDVRARAST